MGKKETINGLPVNLDGVPEHLRERARRAMERFMTSPEGASAFAEAMAKGMNNGVGSLFTLPVIDEEEAPPYPPLSPESEHLANLIGLEIADEGTEWDGETDTQVERIGDEIAKLRFLTDHEKREAYRTIVNARRAAIDFNECWAVCHKQLTLGHTVITDEEDGECVPRLHSTVDTDTLRDLAKTISPNLANLSLLMAQMGRCDEELRALVGLIDGRAHEAGEWPMPSPVNADPA